MQSIFSPWIHKISVGGNTLELNKVVYDKVEAYLDDSRFDSDFFVINISPCVVVDTKGSSSL